MGYVKGILPISTTGLEPIKAHILAVIEFQSLNQAGSYEENCEI